MARSRIVVVFALAAVLSAWGCSTNEGRSSTAREGEDTHEEGNTSAGSAAHNDEGSAKNTPPAKNDAPPAAPQGTGTIHGKVSFSGAAPTPAPLKRDQDPFCARTTMNDETVMVNANKTLRNTMVHLTKGVSGNYPPPSAHATVDQHDCMYRPRVQTIVAGQTIDIKNSDQTLHNIHTYQGTETMFNRAQIAGAPPIEREITEYEGLITLKCDVHNWMVGHILVANHPFASTTGEDGSFTIPNVPVGTYTIEAWHEKFGRKTADVTVTRDGTAEVEFSYAGTETGT